MLSFVMAALRFSAPKSAQASPAACAVPGTIINKLLADFNAATQSVGGPALFTPKQMWAAIVDRDGGLCTVVKVGVAWPGSRAIAIAKASTANDFSNAKLSPSTAMLYGATIPQGSLFGLNNSNTFNPLANDPRIPATGFVPGGIITFGGGVALDVGGKGIGGFGVSGDTACADHNVACTARGMAISQNAVSAPRNSDNIAYENPVVPGHFTHPFCLGGEVPPGGSSPLSRLRRLSLPLGSNVRALSGSAANAARRRRCGVRSSITRGAAATAGRP